MSVAGLVLLRYGWDPVGVLASVLSALVALATRLWPEQKPQADSSFVAAPGTCLDTLADHNLRPAWEQEWRRRRLHDPAPLPVAWRNDDELADQWQNICSSTAPCSPVDLTGRWDDLADTFERVPSRRLVALGEGGQGKSVLCLHLARQLLERRGRGGPVPVLLGLSGWNPEDVGLDEWLEQRLPLDVSPALGDDAGDGRTVARAMVDGGHVVPILDGFDELPTAMQRLAVARINDAGTGPLFLTSRRDEFARATLHDRITAAAVVRVRRLEIDSVSAWLDRTAVPVAAGRTKWTPVLAEVRHEGTVPQRLRTVLTSPLMAALARTVYSESDADPTDLLDHDRTGRLEIEEHLLGQLIPAAYRSGGAGGRPSWSPEQAERYLVTLGLGFGAHGVDRVEWWRLEQVLPRGCCCARIAGGPSSGGHSSAV